MFIHMCTPTKRYACTNMHLSDTHCLTDGITCIYLKYGTVVLCSFLMKTKLDFMSISELEICQLMQCKPVL